ncbi:MAG: hypothetical protein KF882_08330 [Bacteroidia bacterium]|nr:hypothetical protein [Bacteroidia bacterium]MCO5254279.1 DUF6252 family protein [Bacteroidota bacterium]
MKNTITTLSMFCFAMLISCCKDDTTTPNGDKPGTASYMEATINGEPWKACRRIGAVGEENLYAFYFPADGYLQMQCTDYCRKFQETSTSIFFETSSLYDTGYYPLSMFNRANFSLNAPSGCRYANVDSLNGWFYLKEINTEKKYMSGEFGFTGYCEANDSTITITEGRFNRIPY